MDSRQCLWVGGDLTRTKRASDNAWQASAGFARFCRNDVTAPSAPTGVTAAASTGSPVTVQWKASTDASGTVRYRVYRNNLVVATTSSLGITLPAAPNSDTYTVRAFDKAGNFTTSPEIAVVIDTVARLLPGVLD